MNRVMVSFPEFARYLVKFAFADIYAHEGTGLRAREQALVAALTALGNAAPQKVHVHAAAHVGYSAREMAEISMQTAVYAGCPAVLNGLPVAREACVDLGITLYVEA
ncbi:carboxymuconolactone decarboxylase family protein [Noviherbaspirillum massiliense]|uniref:carboxymuconolactone decarboxylase family protein n=1 Tax=Noviherbaspirillum massiliense TaxID=1465823 RepID=UPI00068745DA|nr:carboxymuconolactone decarboxylase family protein [Noviherbaspirillum massiliense]